MKIFLDTNVIFSAAMSDQGAAFEVFRIAKKIPLSLWTSDHCLKELHGIEKKISLEKTIHEFLKRHPLQIVRLKKSKNPLLLRKYVFDRNDQHVVEAAVQVKAEFLITFNTKDFARELLFRDFHLQVLTQGYFLQWLRDTGKSKIPPQVSFEP